MKHSIALKIFGLAVNLLILMIVIAVINSVEIVKLGKEVAEISEISIPIASHAAELNEAGLRRRIAFEPLYREYSFPIADTSVTREAEYNFKKFTKIVSDDIALLKNDLSKLPDDTKERELFVKAREIVAAIEIAFDQQSEITERILWKKKSKIQGDYEPLMAINVQLQSILQDKRSDLQKNSVAIAHLSAIQANNARATALWSSLAITLLSVILGLWGAWLLSRQLARPLIELLQSTRAVHGGDLSVHINGLPENEIGQLGDSLNEMIAELRKKQELQKLISTYIDPRIVEKIILPGREDMLAGKKQIMTVLFCDIVGFTMVSEQLSPTGLVTMINRYLTLMSECIQMENGIIDKYIGDSIMAYWGPPFVKEEEQAAAACRAALRQIGALNQFIKELPDLLGIRKDLPEIDIRIGLATGEVVVGNIGSTKARSYTVMGDIVNLASRLESANKQYGTRILMSEATMLMAGTLIESGEIDEIIVKGKSEQVKIYEVLAKEGELNDREQQRRSRFEVALAAYRNQDWNTAKIILNELVQQFGCKTAEAYLARIHHLEFKHLDASWDGVWRMTSK